MEKDFSEAFLNQRGVLQRDTLFFMYSIQVGKTWSFMKSRFRTFRNHSRRAYKLSPSSCMPPHGIASTKTNRNVNARSFASFAKPIMENLIVSSMYSFAKKVTISSTTTI